MLSYLHGYHAGNAADVLKHSVLIFCLVYLKKKDKPVLCIDTHSGAGLYDYSDSGALPNREWENGIGRLIGLTAPPMIGAYLDVIKSEALSAGNFRYPGSPVIMAKILEKGDRLVCFELHPREFENLKVSMSKAKKAGIPVIELRCEDGPGGLKSLLPPPSRRGLILIDPSWEEKGESENIKRTLSEGLRRFPEGIFIIWYPLLSVPKGRPAASVNFPESLCAFSPGKYCRVELYTGAAESSPRGMYGSGLVIYNPPWTLRAALEESMPFLAKVLGGGEGNWYLDWNVA